MTIKEKNTASNMLVPSISFGGLKREYKPVVHEEGSVPGGETRRESDEALLVMLGRNEPWTRTGCHETGSYQARNQEAEVGRNMHRQSSCES